MRRRGKGGGGESGCGEPRIYKKPRRRRGGRGGEEEGIVDVENPGYLEKTKNYKLQKHMCSVLF